MAAERLSRVRVAFNAFHTFVFYMYFFVGGLLFNLLIAIPMWLLVRLHPPARAIALAIARLYFRGLLAVLSLSGAIRFDRRRCHEVTRAAPVAVYVANHRSLLDVLILLAWVPRATCLVKSVTEPRGKRAKKRSFMPAFWHPFVAVAVDLLGYLPLPVEWNSQTLVETYGRCSTALEAGRPLIIFPEGTRSTDGSMLPFQDFPFKLAIDAGIPIVPVAMVPHIPCMPKSSNSFLDAAERIRFRVEFLDPIQPRPRESAKDLSYSVRRTLQKAVKGAGGA